MPKYSFYAIVDVSFYVGEFDAPTRDKAESMAWAKAVEYDTGVCHQCSDKFDIGEVASLLLDNVDGVSTSSYDNPTSDEVELCKALADLLLMIHERNQSSAVTAAEVAARCLLKKRGHPLDHQLTEGMKK